MGWPGRWLRRCHLKEWWPTLVTGEQEEFCRGKRERDIHGGYSKRRGGQLVVTLAMRGGAGGEQTGGEVVGSG